MSTQNKTTREPVLHISMGGMDRSGQPHQVPQGDRGKWWTQFNMRLVQGRLEQVQRKVKLTEIQTGHKHAVLALVSFPAGTASASNVIALTRKSAYRVTANGMIRLKKETNDVEFTWDKSYYRWDVTMYNNRAFFVNPVNGVHYTAGDMVNSIGSNVPGGTYVEVWYDRLVVGRPVFNGAERVDGVMFSALYQLDDFVPKTSNEADFREFVEYQHHNSPRRGVTGVRRLGDQLMVYNSTTIWSCTYKGQPWIIDTTPISKSIGNTLPYGVISTGDAHYFVSTLRGSFFKLSEANGVEDIGTPMGMFFMDDLNPDPRLRQRTYGFVDDLYDEVGWVYVSKASSNAFDRAIVYNYKTNQWYWRSVEDAQCFCECRYQAQTVDDITFQVDTLSNATCDELAALNYKELGRLWGGTAGRVFQETEDTNKVLDVLSQEVPYLETGDIFFNDTQSEKEEDSITVNATEGVADPAGIQVYVSFRDQFNAPLDYQLMGTWLSTNPDGRLNYNLVTSHSGKILRYKFVWNGLVGTTNETLGIPDRTFTPSGFNGPVYAIVQRDDGKFYVSGRFTTYNGQPAKGLCRINTDGTLDTSFALPGTGFAVTGNYVPPTQLVVAPDQGVYVGLSYSYYYERNLFTDPARWLRLNGVDKEAMFKLLPSGAIDTAFLAHDRNYSLGMCRFDAFGGVKDRLDGYTVSPNYIWMARSMHATGSGYGDDGCVLTQCNKTTGGGIKNLATNGYQSDWPNYTCDVAIVNGQVVFSFFGYSGSTWYFYDVNLDVQTPLSDSPWPSMFGLGIAVFDEAFNPDTNWTWGGYRVPGPVYEWPTPILPVNAPCGSMHTWSRLINGCERNTFFASYAVPVTPITGTWDDSSVGAHRGLFNLRTFGFASNLNLYRDKAGGSEEDSFDWDTGVANGTLYVAFEFYTLKDRLVIEKDGVTLFDSGFRNGNGSITLPFSGASTTITFTVNPTGTDPVDAQTRWRYAASVTGQPFMGSFSPSVWDNATGATQPGFTPAASDPDGYYLGVTPILVKDYRVAGESDRGVFVVGNAVSFMDTPLDMTSPMWYLTADGTLSTTFRLTGLENSFESTWTAPKLPRVFCAAFIGSIKTALIGGRFTKLGGSAAGHFAMINTTNGNRLTSVVIQEGTDNLAESTGGGTMGASFTAFEQNVYAAGTPA